MTDPIWNDAAKQPSENEIAFDYIKSPGFSVQWADGAVGAVTPNGNIHFAIFAERDAIPRRMVYELLADGRIGEENVGKRVSRPSLVRELSSDIVMSLDAAEQLAHWLLETVKSARQDSNS